MANKNASNPDTGDDVANSDNIHEELPEMDIPDFENDEVAAFKKMAVINNTAKLCIL